MGATIDPVNSPFGVIDTKKLRKRYAKNSIKQAVSLTITEFACVTFSVGFAQVLQLLA
jgi:hypothetical protein